MPEDAKRQFDRLVAPHLPTLFRVAWRLLRHTADAEDLVQDTCVAACEHAAALAAANQPVQWLLRVMHNRVIDGARRRKRAPVTSVDEKHIANMPGDAPGPEELLQWTESERLLERAFLQLDETQRVLLALCAEGYELAEIDAMVGGIGKEALSARLYRARRSLAQELAKLQGSTLPRTRSQR